MGLEALRKASEGRWHLIWVLKDKQELARQKYQAEGTGYTCY